MILLVSENSDCHKLTIRCCVPNLKLSLWSKNPDYGYLLHAQLEVVSVKQKPLTMTTCCVPKLKLLLLSRTSDNKIPAVCPS